MRTLSESEETNQRFSATRWLKPPEAARHLRINLQTLYRLVREGKIPAHSPEDLRVIRFDLEELDIWMRTRTPTQEG